MAVSVMISRSAAMDKAMLGPKPSRQVIDCREDASNRDRACRDSWHAGRRHDVVRILTAFGLPPQDGSLPR